LIHAEVGLEVAALDRGGWDTHFAQGGSQGLMAGLLAELARGLAAFQADFGSKAAGVTLLTMSEFGRRAYENGSLGTDHGHGSWVFVIGGGVQGGRVYGRWPGLGEGQLFDPGDLAVTVDYRDVLAEVCALPRNGSTSDALFPGFRTQPLGLKRWRKPSLRAVHTPTSLGLERLATRGQPACARHPPLRIVNPEGNAIHRGGKKLDPIGRLRLWPPFEKPHAERRAPTQFGWRQYREAWLAR